MSAEQQPPEQPDHSTPAEQSGDELTRKADELSAEVQQHLAKLHGKASK